MSSIFYIGLHLEVPVNQSAEKYVTHLAHVLKFAVHSPYSKYHIICKYNMQILYANNKNLFLFASAFNCMLQMLANQFSHLIQIFASVYFPPWERFSQKCICKKLWFATSYMQYCHCPLFVKIHSRFFCVCVCLLFCF